MTNKPITPDEAKACECTMAQSLTGDGCAVCNPKLVLDYAYDQIAELNEYSDSQAEHIIKLNSLVENLTQERNNAAKNVRKELLPKMVKLEELARKRFEETTVLWRELNRIVEAVHAATGVSIHIPDSILNNDYVKHSKDHDDALIEKCVEIHEGFKWDFVAARNNGQSVDEYRAAEMRKLKSNKEHGDG